ncbi:MAG: GNAT family N-acetyltransferase [Geminicoccaceae bacterium]
MSVVIEQISPFHPKARALLASAREASDGLYPPTSQHGLDSTEAAEGVMLVAWLDHEPVGCGVIRPLEDGIGEIKRMYVSPSCRRQGVARKILAALEALAPKLGFQNIRLETGTLQPEAIALYKRAGYARIEPFGEYVDDPLSICFEKWLDGKVKQPAS